MVQKMYFGDRVARIERCLNAAGISRQRSSLVNDNLLNNTLVEWRMRILAGASRDGFFHRVSIVDPFRFDEAGRSDGGVVLLLCRTCAASILVRWLDHRGVDEYVVLGAEEASSEEGLLVLKRGGIVLVVADSFEKRAGMIPRPFLGKMCYLNENISEYAILAESVILPVHVSMTRRGGIEIVFDSPLDPGSHCDTREERVNLLIDQAWGIIQSLWRKDFGNVPWDRMDSFLAQAPVTESVSYSPPWRSDGKKWPMTMTEDGFHFLLIEYPDRIELDSSFEDIPGIYAVERIEELISRYEKKYGKPVRFLSMNESHSDGRTIIYRNFAWSLYRNIDPPKPTVFKYDFTYLVGYPRQDKLDMLTALHLNGLLNRALWSCGSYPNDEGRCLPDLPKVLDFDKSLKHDQTCWTGIRTEFYTSSRFSLVQETEMQCSTNRYTEKTYKCFWMKHPFVLAGNYRSLELLRRDGFETFHPHIDESYDGIRDRAERIQAIVREVKRLCGKSEKEWGFFINEVETILDHNYRMAVQKSADFRGSEGFSSLAMRG